MFATFAVAPRQNTGSIVEGQPSEHVTPKPSKPLRPKRHQVGRACIWCRTYRIKCDTNFPCQNCKIKGRRCSDENGKDAGEVRTFSTAVKEIDRLRERVKELEDQVKGLEVGSEATPDDTTAPPIESPGALPVNLDPVAQHGSNKKYYNWDFVSARTDRTNQQFYGPSSSFYFISQMMTHLNKSLHNHNIDIHPRVVDKPKFLSSVVSASADRARDGYDLTRSEEDRLIELFLQSYHGIYPVIEVDVFKRQHAILWRNSATNRKPSALHDIILALAMQYGASISAARRANSENDTEEIHDATTAGRWLYRRCQSQLSDELEGPSITTFQCHLLSVIWLSNASFQNMAHNVMALGIRTGVILGLHLDPCPELPTPEREFKRRLWWTLYALEMKFAMELGRPLAVSISQVTCCIPDDIPLDNPIIVGSTSPPLTAFHSQLVKLILATRAIYITFYRKCASALNKSPHKYLHEDPIALESCAEFLHSRAKYLQIWLSKVPQYMKMRREDPGWSYATDRSRLQLPTQIPPWLSRQLVFLELSYHDLCMSLYRPFISFGTTSTSQSPSTSNSTSTSATMENTPTPPPTSLTHTHALTCLSHALTTTSHIHQLLTSTSLLDGFHEPFRWQWNATLSLLGYMLAYPESKEIGAARKGVDTAIEVFERLARSFRRTRGAVDVTRELVGKVDVVLGRSGGDDGVDGVERGRRENQTASLSVTDRMLRVEESTSLPDANANGNANENGNGHENTTPLPPIEPWSYLPTDETLLSSGSNPNLNLNTNLHHSFFTNPSGFAFTFDTGMENIGLEEGSMFDLLDFEDMDVAGLGFGGLE